MVKDVDPGFENDLSGDSADQLKSIVIRIENIEEEIRILNASKQDIYGEARACGFDKGAIRYLMKRRAMGQKSITKAEVYEDLLDNIFFESKEKE